MRICWRGLHCRRGGRRVGSARRDLVDRLQVPCLGLGSLDLGDCPESLRDRHRADAVGWLVRLRLRLHLDLQLGSLGEHLGLHLDRLAVLALLVPTATSLSCLEDHLLRALATDPETGVAHLA
eukprot:8704081-Pyramimonas_sp.AAC.1